MVKKSLRRNKVLKVTEIVEKPSVCPRNSIHFIRYINTLFVGIICVFVAVFFLRMRKYFRSL